MNEPSHEKQLESILHAYLQAVDAGGKQDRDELLRQHPDLADELREFFADAGKMDRFAQSLHKAQIGDATIGAEGVSDTGDTLPRLRYFGDYELLEEIARGGMGVVYKARQVSLTRIVAIKMILAGQLASDADVQRFRAEAEAAANLDHPNIVPIYEIGDHEGQQYFSMKLIEGGSLAGKIAEFGADARKATALLATVAGAVHYAHQRGILHRDLKPANILLDAHEQPLVTDFGLAKRVEGDSELTRSGAIVGTPSYMAPEQAAAQKGLSIAVDVYSLGAIHYELLTGRPPFRGETPLETLRMVVEKEPDRPSVVKPGIDRDLETICLKSLQKDPQKRYRSAEALADDLGRWLRGEPIEARPVSQSERVWRWCRRNPAVVGWTAGLINVFLVGTITTMLFAFDARHEAERAEDNATKARANEKDALREKERADQEAEQAEDILARSLFEQAQALRRSIQPGRRGIALSLLQEAEKLRGRERKVKDLPAREFAGLLGLSAKLPTKLELRNEAAALLLSQDARQVRELDLGLGGMVILPALSLDGRLVASSWFEFDMPRLAKGDMTGSKVEVQITDLSPEGKSARWETPYTGAHGFAPPWSAQINISPDNKWIASAALHPAASAALHPATASVKVEFRDLWKGNVIKSIDWPKDKESDIAGQCTLTFSPDGQYLAGVQHGLRQIEFALWNLKTGKSAILYREKKPAVTVEQVGWMIFSANSKLLAYPSGEKTITLWDLAKDARGLEIKLPLLSFGYPSFGFDDRLLAVPCKNWDDNQMTIAIWDIVQNVEKSRFLVNSEGIERLAMRGLAFRPGTSELAMADGSSIALVDALQGKEIFRFEAGSRAGVSRLGLGLLAWQPDGRRLVSSPLGGPLKVWELSEPPPLYFLHPKVEKFRWFSFSPDGKWLAVSAAKSPSHYLLNRQTGKVEREFVPDPKNPDPGVPRMYGFPLLFRPDGKQVAAVRGQFGPSVALVWDFETGKEIDRLDQKDAYIRALAYGPQGQLFVADIRTGKPSVWDVHAKRRVWQTSGDADSLCFLSPNGRFLASTTLTAHQVTLWELPEGRKLGSIAVPETPGGVTFSPNGSLVAIGHGSPLDWSKGKRGAPGLGVWSVPSGKKVLERRNQADAIFSPDSRLLAAGTPEGFLKFWDIASDTEVLSVAFPGGVFTPDGSSLAMASPSANPLEGSSAIQFLDLAGLRRRLAEMGLDW
jgi:eukaryotic-like serine/threonine-protein kinase